MKRPEPGDYELTPEQAEQADVALDGMGAIAVKVLGDRMEQAGLTESPDAWHAVKVTCEALGVLGTSAARVAPELIRKAMTTPEEVGTVALMAGLIAMRNEAARLMPNERPWKGTT